jgi:ribosome maturation protein SDO1
VLQEQGPQLAQWSVSAARLAAGAARLAAGAADNPPLSAAARRETDLDEVLQSTTVFANVSKGVLAKREDLIQAFGTDDSAAICRRILAEGELQVSDKERRVELDEVFRDVASVLSEKCINPETRKPYTISMLERALRDAHFSVDPKRAAKAQAAEALRALEGRLPIQRARMRLRLLVPLGAKEELTEMLAARGAVVEERGLQAGMVAVTCLVEPGAYRPLHALAAGAGSGGRVDVLALAVAADEPDAETSLPPALFITGPSAPPDGGLELAARPSGALASSGFAPAAAVASVPAPRAAPTSGTAPVVCSRGPIAELPEEHASRRERFSELDALQPGWTVELRGRGDGAPVEAVFFSPAGERAGAFAAARRAALQASKAAAGAATAPVT